MMSVEVVRRRVELRDRIGLLRDVAGPVRGVEDLVVEDRAFSARPRRVESRRRSRRLLVRDRGSRRLACSRSRPRLSLVLDA